MPLIVFMQNGAQFPIKGEKVDERDWRGGRKIKRETMNGHEMIINTANVNMVEFITQADYDRMMAEARERQKIGETEAGDGRSPIVRPRMVVPGPRR